MADGKLAEYRTKYPQYNDLSDEQLAEGLRKKYYADMSPEDFKAKIGLTSAPQGQLNAFGNQRAQQQGEAVQGPGALYRFGKGMKDVLDAGAQLALHTMPESVNNIANDIGRVMKTSPDPLLGGLARAMDIQPTNQEQFDRELAQNEATYQGQREMGGQDGLDLARMGGQITASLPLTRGIPVAATLPGAIASGAAGGALFGLLNPVTDEQKQEDFWTTKAKDSAISAGIAGPLSGLMNIGGKILAPKVDQAVQYLMDKGVTPTFGQLGGGVWNALENKATSIPLLGDMIKNAQRRTVEDFNKAAIDEVLAPIGAKVNAIGREGIEQAEDAISSAYKAILPKLTYQADDTFKAELQNIASMAKELPEPQFKQFMTIIKNKVASRLSPQGTMDGQTFKGVESEFTNLVKGYMRDPSFDQRQLGSALAEIQRALRENLTRTNPQFAPELTKINSAYARFARIRDAAARIGSDEGAFTPAQLQSAVRAGDQSVGKGKFAKGEALLQDLSEAGKSVMSSYPDSGTAGRMMAGGAGLLGLGALEPTSAAALGTLTLPYTKLGQDIVAALMTKRPDVVRQMGGLMTKAAPIVGPVAGILGAPYVQ